MNWTRIPVDSFSDADRRTLAAVLVAGGLEVRIAKVKEKSVTKRYVEYREMEATAT